MSEGNFSIETSGIIGYCFLVNRIISKRCYMPSTMFDKIWESHIVHEEVGKPTILYVDLHLVHEVTSAQAFEG